MNERRKLVKKCLYCGKINEPETVRCLKCGKFLGRTQSELLSSPAEGVIVTVELETGETISLRNNDILGREYQPEVWDSYTPRAMFRVYSDNGVLMLEDLKYKKRTKLDYNSNYKAGRKNFNFVKKRGLISHEQKH